MSSLNTQFGIKSYDAIGDNVKIDAIHKRGASVTTLHEKSKPWSEFAYSTESTRPYSQEILELTKAKEEIEKAQNIIRSRIM